LAFSIHAITASLLGCVGLVVVFDKTICLLRFLKIFPDLKLESRALAYL
jgi:hypothetical protein